MRFKHLSVLAMAAVMIPGLAASATNYKLDPGHSHVRFSAVHFGVSEMVCVFNEVNGTVAFDADDFTKSAVEVTINTQSLTSENPKRVDAIKSPFFLNVEEFPTITFKSSSIKKEKEHHYVTGDLTIHGVTKTVSFPFEVTGPIPDPWGNPRIGIAAELTVNRRDFGIEFDKKSKEGVPFVGDDVTIVIRAESVPTE